jgi:predicted dehydrogenase
MAELEAPVRLAVVGLGRVFERFHLPALLDCTEARLVGVWDQDPERCAWGREHLPGVPVAYDFPDLLRYQAEALLVLTPPESHAPLTCAALGAGLHVLVEKPMALGRAEATQMAEAARTARRRLQIGFTRRFREPYRRVKTRLPSLDSRATVAFELSFPPGGWGAGKDPTGGGVLDDVLPHQTDLLRFLLGASPRQARVTSHTAQRIECELEFPGGVIARCVTGHGAYREWLAISLAGTSYVASGSLFREGSNAASAWSKRLALVSDKASLAVARVLRTPNVTDRSFGRQLRDFVAAVRGRAATGAGSADGLAAIAVGEACRRSLPTGDWVAVA